MQAGLEFKHVNRAFGIVVKTRHNTNGKRHRLISFMALQSWLWKGKRVSGEKKNPHRQNKSCVKTKTRMATRHQNKTETNKHKTRNCNWKLKVTFHRFEAEQQATAVSAARRSDCSSRGSRCVPLLEATVELVEASGHGKAFPNSPNTAQRHTPCRLCVRTEGGKRNAGDLVSVTDTAGAFIRGVAE